MATRIRLQRFGKKNQPFYHIVIADGRAPRDGRFIEKIGTYNPLSHPADIKINFDRALYWVECGATPSETVQSILKREGVYMMKHLKGGVAKGAFTEMEADQKFSDWQATKESKFNNLKKDAADKVRTEMKKRFEQETKVKEAMMAKVAAKYAKVAAQEAHAAAEVAESVVEVESVEEVAAKSTEETTQPVAENTENSEQVAE